MLSGRQRVCTVNEIWLVLFQSCQDFQSLVDASLAKVHSRLRKVIVPPPVSLLSPFRQTTAHSSIKMFRITYNNMYCLYDANYILISNVFLLTLALSMHLDLQEAVSFSVLCIDCWHSTALCCWDSSDTSWTLTWPNDLFCDINLNSIFLSEKILEFNSVHCAIDHQTSSYYYYGVEWRRLFIVISWSWVTQRRLSGARPLPSFQAQY